MPPSTSTLPASAYEALGLSEEVVRIATTPRPIPTPIASPNLLQDAPEPEQRLAMNESSITLYAELLLHIRTVTLFASLRTVHNRETKARLASNGCAITVTHEGVSATIRLPIQVEGGGDASLSLPASPPSKDLTLRLQIEEKEGSNMLGTLLSEERKSNIVPWTGTSLGDTEKVTVYCKCCQQVILPAGMTREWRDLPNENWAEMMDFWHCHKPDEHHLHDHAQKDAIGKKGYSAGNRLQATEGVGFVDLASFLLKAGDCQGIEVGFTISLQPVSTRRVYIVGHKRTWTRPLNGVVADTNALEERCSAQNSHAFRSSPLVDGPVGAVGERLGRFTAILPEVLGNGGIEQATFRKNSYQVHLFTAFFFTSSPACVCNCADWY